jgi:hypothetical protein
VFLCEASVAHTILLVKAAAEMPLELVEMAQQQAALALARFPKGKWSKWERAPCKSPIFVFKLAVLSLISLHHHYHLYCLILTLPRHHLHRLLLRLHHSYKHEMHPLSAPRHIQEQPRT